MLGGRWRLRSVSCAGRVGRIESSFGQGGKFKVYFPLGIGLEELKTASAATDQDEEPDEKNDKRNKRGSGKERASLKSK